MFRRGWQWLAACLFPVFCVSCQQEGEWWCKKCRPQPPQPTIIYPGSSLTSVTAFFNYNPAEPVGQLIKIFKYHRATSLSTLWAELVVAPWLSNSGMTVIPVPLYHRRARERGFNQAEVLAKIVAEKYHLPLEIKKLQRVRATEQQARLSREERAHNVAGAFGWVGSGKAPAQVLLIDDVFTTGATMQSCAAELLANGSVAVHALVLAMGEDRSDTG